GADAIPSAAWLGDLPGAGSECIGAGSRRHRRDGREGRHARDRQEIPDGTTASAWTEQAMTSPRQLEANRHNALKSTGPTSANGRDRARRNALRHGFTAETVLEPLENAGDYRAFEAAILSEYLPQTPVEQELVRRLASLFWRLRRATSIETG